MMPSLLSTFATPYLIQTPTPLHSITHPTIQLYVKREDLRFKTPYLTVGGNKWCKLQGFMLQAQAQGVKRLVSFGGAWSNHLHALAAVGHLFNLQTVGLVRHHREQPPLPVTAMQQDALNWGMQLYPLSATDYRKRYDADLLAQIAQRFAPCLVIPEGGNAPEADVGLQQLAIEIAMQCQAQFGASPIVLAVAVGTGTTFLGLVQYLPSHFTVIGFQTYRDATLSARLNAKIAAMPQHAAWQLLPNYGLTSTKGIAKSSWLNYIKQQYEQHQLPLDPIYTAGVFYRLNEMTDQFTSQTVVVMLHSGGHQGLRSLEMAYL